MTVVKDTKISLLPELTSPDNTAILDYLKGVTNYSIAIDHLSNHLTAGGVMLYTKRIITAAELAAMFTTPINVLPAPGALKIFVPYLIIGTVDNAAAAWTGTDDIAFKYAGGSQYTEDISGLLKAGGEICQGFRIETPADIRTNTAFQAYFTAGQPSGGARVFTAHIWYYLFDV